MDGVSWSATRAQETFSRTRTTADTLSKLATFIARADPKQQGRNQRQQSPHRSTYDCQECVQGSPYTTDLHQELKHTLPKPHWCPSCGQEFSLRSSLQLHKCDHESSPCELCHGKSRHGSPCPACTSHASGPCRTQEKSLHLLDTSPYACAPCGKGFSQKQALLHHQQAGCSESPSLLDIADACGFADDSPPVSEADSTRSDSSDIPGCSTETFNTCQFCSRSFRTEAALQRHTQTNHAADWPISSKGQNSKGEDGSREARKGGYSKLNGEPVKGTKSKSKLLSCRSCELVFSSTSKLYRHRKEKHSRDTKMRRESRPVIVKHRRRGTYSCELCAKVFFHHLSLRAHYRQHTTLSFAAVKHNSQSVVCTTKDSTMSENRPNKLKSSLANNNALRAGPGRPKKEARSERISGPGRGEVPEVEEEEGEREFPCPSCAEVFSLQSQLREHVELHQSSVKRRTCSVCACDMDTCKWPGSKRQRLYHCVPCQQGFSTLDSFLEHCQEHLRVRVEEDCITEGYTHPAGKA